MSTGPLQPISDLEFLDQMWDRLKQARALADVIHELGDVEIESLQRATRMLRDHLDGSIALLDRWNTETRMPRFVPRDPKEVMRDYCERQEQAQADGGAS